jgi:DNA-binding response OmpR family regulator
LSDDGPPVAVLGLRPLAARDEGTTPPWPPVPPARRRTTLYVNGDPDCRILIRRLARRWLSAELVVADSAASGLSAAELLRPDAVVLDEKLADGAGYDVLVALRERPRTHNLPVAYLTSDPSRASRDRLRHAGASAVMTKPLNIGTLDRTLRCLMGLPVT